MKNASTSAARILLAGAALEQPVALQSVDEPRQAAARELNQDFVGTEHLVLGILDCPDSEAVRAIQRGAVSPAELRERLTASLPRGGMSPTAA